MKPSAQFNPLILVNIAISNARSAGIELDQQQIDMFWKIARGEMTGSEIQDMSQNASESMRLRSKQQYGHLTAENVDIDALKKKISEVFEILSVKF